MLTAFADGCAGKHWDCQVFNLHHLQPPGGTFVPCCAFSCLLFGCVIFSICGTICEEEGLQDWTSSKGLVPKALEHFFLAAPLFTIFCVRRCSFFVDRYLGAVLFSYLAYSHACAQRKKVLSTCRKRLKRVCCALRCVPCCRATRWRFPFEALLLGGSTPLQLNRFGCIQIRSGCNCCSDDHTVTAHGRPLARGKGAVEREMSTAALRINWFARVADQSVRLLRVMQESVRDLCSVVGVVLTFACPYLRHVAPARYLMPCSRIPDCVMHSVFQRRYAQHETQLPRRFWARQFDEQGRAPKDSMLA